MTAVKNFSLLEAVEMAVQMEEEGVHFYTLAMEKLQDDEMKNLLTLLRKKEYEHINTFRGFASELAGREGMADAELYITDPEVSAYFRAFVESTVFPAKGDAERVVAGARDAADILRLAMRVEKDSILFYHDLLTHSPYPAAAEALKKIIAEERKHLRAILDLWVKRGRAGAA